MVVEAIDNSSELSGSLLNIVQPVGERSPAFPVRKADPGVWRSRTSGIAIVVGAHLLLLLMLAHIAPIRSGETEERDITVSLLKSSPPPQPDLRPLLQNPSAEVISPPDIEIADAQSDTNLASVVTIPAWQILPPRPDPLKVNEPPQLPAEFRRLGGGISALLRVFVMRDGDISEAQLARSTGTPDLDAMLIQYVKRRWHFLPASYSGTPLQEWTTVLVRFRP